MSGVSPWSGQQQAWLRELGHDVMVLGSAADVVAAPSRDGTPAEQAGLDVRTRAPTARPSTPQRQATPIALENALLRALAHAAKREPEDEGLRAALPDLATLRGNPRARRALWPVLRALRKVARS
ncbi:hypothetical protein [Lysobacter fragariae]